ncbi:hypothetical protein TrispH2_006764 [Trichoplax sp. H2]|nr:hypothetical protein TrispH2_006764 [Trichoplax sp. H2]|eukprot:RDD40393.1 hypothetical protein TrispH2_006764 [Trichoplax sp. H2]
MAATMNSELILEAKRLSPRPPSNRNQSRMPTRGKRNQKQTPNKASNFMNERALNEVAMCQLYQQNQTDSISHESKLSCQEDSDRIQTPFTNGNYPTNTTITSTKVFAENPIESNQSVDANNNNEKDTNPISILSTNSVESKEPLTATTHEILRNNVYDKKPSTSPAIYNQEVMISFSDDHDNNMNSIYLNKPNTSPVNSRLAQKQEVMNDSFILPKNSFGNHLFYLPALCKSVDLQPNYNRSRQSQKTREGRIPSQNQANTTKDLSDHYNYELHQQRWVLTGNIDRYSLGTLKFGDKSKEKAKSSPKYPVHGTPTRKHQQSMTSNYYNNLYQYYAANQSQSAINQYLSRQYHRNNAYRSNRKVQHHKRKKDKNYDNDTVNPWIYDSPTATPTTLDDRSISRRSQIPDDDSDYVKKTSQMRVRSNTNNSNITLSINPSRSHSNDEVFTHPIPNVNYDGDISHDSFHRAVTTTPVDEDNDQPSKQEEEVPILASPIPPSITDINSNSVAIDSQNNILLPDKPGSPLPVIQGKSSNNLHHPQLLTDLSQSLTTSASSDKITSLSLGKIKLSDQGKSKSTSSIRYNQTLPKSTIRKGINGMTEKQKYQDTQSENKEEILSSTLIHSNEFRNGSPKREPLPDDLIILNLTKKMQDIESKNEKSLSSSRSQQLLWNTSRINSYSRQIEAMSNSEAYCSPRLVGREIDQVLGECLTSQQVLASSSDFGNVATVPFASRPTTKVVTRNHDSLNHSHPNDTVIHETSLVSVKGNKLTYL